MPDAAPSSNAPDPGDGWIMLFDGVCNLCNGTVNLVLRHDRRRAFRFASIQSPAGRRLYERHGIDPSALGTMMVVGRGQAHVRSDAALVVARELGGWWRLLAVFRLVPRPLRDAAYRWVARNRYRWFGRAERCRVPTPDLRARFLE